MKDILTYLKKNNPEEARQAALQFLGEEAIEWDKHRGFIEGKRICDIDNNEYSREFTANSKAYYVLNVTDQVNVVRMTTFKQCLAMMYRDEHFQNQLNWLIELEALANTLVTSKPQLVQLINKISEAKNKLMDSKNRKWDYAYIACACFIVRKDEDIKTFDMNLANEKIEDWSKEGIAAEDFFVIASLWGLRLNNRKKELNSKLEQLAKSKGYI